MSELQEIKELEAEAAWLDKHIVELYEVLEQERSRRHEIPHLIRELQEKAFGELADLPTYEQLPEEIQWKLGHRLCVSWPAEPRWPVDVPMAGRKKRRKRFDQLTLADLEGLVLYHATLAQRSIRRYRERLENRQPRDNTARTAAKHIALARRYREWYYIKLGSDHVDEKNMPFAIPKDSLLCRRCWPKRTGE